MKCLLLTDCLYTLIEHANVMIRMNRNADIMCTYYDFFRRNSFVYSME